MIVVVQTTATVTCTCWLSEEESEKVVNYADETGLELEDAVAELYDKGELNLYDNSTESDFSTESIDSAIRE